MAKGVSAGHTACRKGTKVVIKTRSGEKIIDKFIERKGNGRIILENHSFRKSEIRFFAIYKHPAHNG